MELSIFRLRRNAQIIKYSWWFPVERNAYDFTKKGSRKQNGKFRFSKQVTCILKTVKEKQSSYNVSDVTEKMKEV